MDKSRSSLKEDSQKEVKFFSQFKSVSVMLSGIALVLFFLVPQVTGLKVAEVSSFYTEDAHCVETTVLTKIHCFGDFGYAIKIVRSGKNVWDSDYSNPYPPLNFQLYLLFSFIAAKISYLFSLVFYLGTLILAMLIPFLHAIKSKKFSEKVKVISVCLLATLPFMIVLDRGNNNVWPLPFIYFFIAARYGKVPRRYEVIFAAIAIAFRPQNLVLLALFLSKREYKKIFKTVGLSVLLNVLSFLMWDSSRFIENLTDQINQILRYNSGVPGVWPPSLSFSRGMKTIAETIGFEMNDSIYKYIGYFIASVVIFRLIRVKNRYSDAQIFYLVLPLMFLLPDLSWYYYSSLLLVIIATTFLLATPVKSLGMNSEFRGNLFLGAVIATTAPLFMPIWQGQYNITQVFVPIIWLITYIVLAFSKWKTS